MTRQLGWVCHEGVRELSGPPARLLCFGVRLPAKHCPAMVRIESLVPVTPLSLEMLSWFPPSGWEVFFANLAPLTFLVNTLGSYLCVRDTCVSL